MDLVSKNVKVPKSMAKICILQILGETTFETPLTQDEMRHRLKKDYGIFIDRKTMRRHLMELVECIDRIHYSVETRMVNGVESEMMSRFWIKQDDDLEESQLRALIYCVIFSKHIPTRAKEEMVRKLESLSSSDINRPAIYSGTVKVNYESMRDFALRNAPCIEVIEPIELRNDLKDAYLTALGYYEDQ